MEHLWHARFCVKCWEYKSKHSGQSPCLKASFLNQGTRYLSACSELFLHWPWPSSWYSIPKPRCPLWIWAPEGLPQAKSRSLWRRRLMQISPHCACVYRRKNEMAEATERRLWRRRTSSSLTSYGPSSLKEPSEGNLSEDPQGSETGPSGHLS